MKLYSIVYFIVELVYWIGLNVCVGAEAEMVEGWEACQDNPKLDTTQPSHITLDRVATEKYFSSDSNNFVGQSFSKVSRNCE